MLQSLLQNVSLLQNAAEHSLSLAFIRLLVWLKWGESGFHWVLKVLHINSVFFLCLMIGSRNTHQFQKTVGSKTKSDCDFFMHFFFYFIKLRPLYWTMDCSVSFVIGQDNYLVLVLGHSIENCSMGFLTLYFPFWVSFCFIHVAINLGYWSELFKGKLRSKKIYLREHSQFI